MENTSILGGLSKAFSGVGSLVGGAMSGAGSILKFGWNHPILTGILGVVGYKALEGASNAKGSESAGIAAANGIGGLFQNIMEMVKGAGKAAVEAGKEIGDSITSKLTDKENVAELAESDVDVTVETATTEATAEAETETFEVDGV